MLQQLSKLAWTTKGALKNLLTKADQIMIKQVMVQAHNAVHTL
jgi:hypothetical protein